jgi:uncharacterized repeat protein (TIGR01451 family)
MVMNSLTTKGHGNTSYRQVHKEKYWMTLRVLCGKFFSHRFGVRNVLLFFLLLTVFSAPARAAPWQEKVSPQVLAALEQGESDFLVVLQQQADLHLADALPTKQAKGEYVYQTLTALADRTQPSVVAILEDAGAPYQAYWVANMIWAHGDAQLAQQLAALPEVAALAANPSMPLDLLPQSEMLAPQAVESIEWNISLVNADDVWAAGFTGQGVVVAGQDTGYLWNHPALKTHYRGWDGSTPNHDYNWHDAVDGSTVPLDPHGHGTHTMGTMVGDDGAGNQIGMAPGARWIGCRNMNSNGAGTPQTYAECFQWFVAPTKIDGSSPRPDLAPDVINNSWGCPLNEGCDLAAVQAMQTVVENVRAAGIMVVASAGNAGAACGTVNDPPAVYDASFTVAATDSSDNVAYFSSRGPADYTGLPKPDISAPGTGIRSAASGGGYVGMQGTSMAAPHVAGEVALLLSAVPALRGDVDALESAIRQSAMPRTSTQTCGGVDGGSVPNNVYGWGRIDAWAAYQLLQLHNLHITKYAPPIVTPDMPITYTLTVSYTGFLPTHGVVLSDVLPLNTTFITATLPFTHTGDVITWGLGDLSDGESRSVTLAILPTGGLGSIITNEKYSARSQEVTTPVSGSPVVTTVVDYLSLSMSAPAQVDVGGYITYTLTITNNHTSQPSRPLVLTDTLPISTTFAAASQPYTLAGNLVTWNLPALDAGHAQMVTLTVRAPNNASKVINSNYAMRSDDFSLRVFGPPVVTWVVWRSFLPAIFR